MSALLYEHKRPVSGLLIITVLRLKATLHEAGTFRDSLFKEIESGTRILIINFEKVEFIDSTFLGALVVIWKKISSLNGSLVLTNLNTKVIDTFTITQLDNKLTITATVEDALRLFKARD